MQVRRATVEDLPGLVPLFDGYRQFYHQAPDPSGSEQFLADRLGRGDSVIFVAEELGILLGFTQLYPIFSSVSARTAWLLNDLFVDPVSRNRGVARVLLERAAGFGRETGACWLSLATQRSNLPAQHLYEALGWTRDDAFLHYELALP